MAWRLPVVVLTIITLALEVPSFLGAPAVQSSGALPTTNVVTTALPNESVTTYENVVSEVLSEPDAIDDTYIDCTQTPCVALTLDDGPGAYTAQVLEILDEFDARATFYVVGQQLASWPGMLPSIVDAGHDIGNHTMSHPKLSEIGAPDRLEEIRGVDDMVFREVGIMPTTIRPPFGDLPDTPLPDNLNRPVVLWSVDALDWKKRTTDDIVDEVLDDIGPGDIILMHEMYQRSVDALPIILTELNERGLKVVSVADLLGPSLFVSGDITHVPYVCGQSGSDNELPKWCQENPDWVRTID